MIQQHENIGETYLPQTKYNMSKQNACVIIFLFRQDVRKMRRVNGKEGGGIFWERRNISPEREQTIEPSFRGIDRGGVVPSVQRYFRPLYRPISPAIRRKQKRAVLWPSRLGRRLPYTLLTHSTSTPSPDAPWILRIFPFMRNGFPLRVWPCTGDGGKFSIL